MAIGKRMPVNDIKTIWKKEPEFSQWLASPDGLELLAQDLEIQIENPKLEAKGSNFSCDIVANLVGEEKHVVVIENQFGRTDHDHLGKLMTYAATHKAMTGIWITEEAAEDHREAVDWLNENTPVTISFYLAELKAYRIGDSPVAPELDVVCRPNVTMKTGGTDITESEKKRRAWRQAFWTDIHKHIKAANPPFNLQKPSGDHWSSIAIGRTDFHISMLLTPKNQSIGVELIIQPDWKDSAFDQLKAQEAEIEAGLGRKLDWRPLPGKGSARILLEEKLDPDHEPNREKICHWFGEWAPKLYSVMKPRILKLQAPE